MSIAKRFSVIAIVLVAAFAITGCSKGADAGNTPVAEETPTPVPAAEETPTPVPEETPAPEEEKEEETKIEDDGIETDLMDYFGQSIEEVSSLFPNLEIMSNEGYYDKNGTVYIDKEEEFDGVLSGPEFDTDSDSNIVGITYSGRNYAVAGLYVTMTVAEATDTLKKDGWTFSEVGVTHGTAQYYAVYGKDDLELSFVSTDDGVFGKDKESDITGFVQSISVAKRK